MKNNRIKIIIILSVSKYIIIYEMYNKFHIDQSIFDWIFPFSFPFSHTHSFFISIWCEQKILARNFSHFLNKLFWNMRIYYYSISFQKIIWFRWQRQADNGSIHCNGTGRIHGLQIFNINDPWSLGGSTCIWVQFHNGSLRGKYSVDVVYGNIYIYLYKTKSTHCNGTWRIHGITEFKMARGLWVAAHVLR